ncbi:MAG: extracellular solute-binding protein [Clostridiales bacterium]|nr:extracellular solute-binding protein [Clostridiales bacterium]
MKKLVSLLLTLAMLLSIAAIPAAAEATGIESWQPFAENVTITVPVYDRSKVGYPAVDDNYWTRWIQKEFGDKYNVTVNYVAIPRGDVMTKYSMLIAAGETPTILMEYDYPKVAQWANDGAMTTIDLDAFKAVAPTFYQKMVENDQLGYTDINGQTYFVLTERPYYNEGYTWAVFCRLDWLKAVGYDHYPTSYAEYADAMDKIIKAGLTDQAPLGLGIPASAYINNFSFRNIPVDEEEWAMHSSLGTPCFTWDATRAMLKRTNAEYNKGWYSSEFDMEKNTAGMATDQLQTDFINGKSFSYGGYMGANVAWLTAFYENNPDAELCVAGSFSVEEPGVAVAQARADNPFGMIVGFSSLASEDQLKAAWMLMEWMLAGKASDGRDVLFVLENGVEGVTYEINAETGLPVVYGDYTGEEMLNHNMNIDMTCLVHASKVVGTVEDSIRAIAPQGLPKDFSQELIDNWYNCTHTIAQKGHAYTDPIFSVTIDSESEYSATLLALYQEDYAKLVKCAPEEFDALYDQLAKEFLEAGYQEVIDERLAAYEAGNCTHLPESVKNATAE